jgi:hypothetical protein
MPRRSAGSLGRIENGIRRGRWCVRPLRIGSWMAVVLDSLGHSRGLPPQRPRAALVKGLLGCGTCLATRGRGCANRVALVAPVVWGPNVALVAPVV